MLAPALVGDASYHEHRRPLTVAADDLEEEEHGPEAHDNSS